MASPARRPRSPSSWLAAAAAVALGAATATGCAASGLQTVSGARWRAVPTAERAAIERADQARLAAAVQAEQRATAELAAARVEAARPAHVRRAAAPPPAIVADDAALARAWREREVARTRALDQVDATQAAWRRARIAWRARRLDQARLAVSMARCAHELARAQAVDSNTTWDDDWDVTPYRGQLATVQAAWYRAADRVTDAQRALAGAGAGLADAKEAYARVVRGDAGATASNDAPAPRAPAAAPAPRRAASR